MSDFLDEHHGQYDKQGRPITVNEWSRLHSDLEYRVVARTELDEGVMVSTVWLGIDHSWGDGPPIIFETMVFGGPLDQDQYRYATEAQAWEGHAFVVGRVRSALTSG